MSNSNQDISTLGPSGFYLALFFTILAIFLVYLTRRRKSSNTVLLLGLSDSGKTGLFTKLIFNKRKKSVTSLTNNVAECKDLNLHVIDLPGADRLRDIYWEQHKANANRIIFVIDSTTIQEKIRDVSEYLYGLLSDGIIYKNKIQFTVACNKQDLDGSIKKDEIQALLQRELKAIQTTKAGQLEKTSNEEIEDYIAKKFGTADEIELNQLNVQFIETSIFNIEHLMRILI